MTCLYLYQKEGKTIFTGQELFQAQEDAAEYWNSKLPQDFWDQRDQILNKNGFTEPEWKEVLQYSGSMMFIADERMEKTNKEIKKLCSKYDVMNGTWYQSNAFYAELSNIVRRNKVIYLVANKSVKPITYKFIPYEG